MEPTPAQPPAVRPRLQDVVWLLLFLALGAAGPERTAAELQVLAGLAVIQILEPRIGWFATPRGTVAAVALKLMLAWLLVGVTGGISSSYYLILMVPVVSAVATLGAWGTLGVSLAAAVSYLSFLLFIDWNRQTIPPDEVRELILRLLLFAVVAMLMHQLAASSRAQALQYKETAGRLAEANRSLEAAEAVARRSERLAALGQLTAGLAHELRNPLGTMRASSDMLLKHLPPGESIPRELAGYIRDEVDRTSSLVTRFLDFARPLELHRAVSDWNEMVDRAVARFEAHQPPYPVVVIRNYSPDIAPFAFDADLMERVLFNLVLNAAQASPAEAAERAPVTVRTRTVPGGVEAAVIDRGTGIDPAQRESIFNPFYTTKPGGTGLGLAISARIVSEHGGTIGVDSQPGQGSTFRVVLPVAGRA